MEQIEFLTTSLNVDEEEFLSSKMLQLAALRSLEIIGEAVGRISKELKEEYKEVNWAEMVKARNYYVHQYFAVDWRWVWRSMKSEIDFDVLRLTCEAMLSQLENN